MSQPTTLVDSTPSPARLIRGLERRFVFVLLAVAGLLLIDQAVLQPLLVRLNGLAPAINLAGRQRMLSQRITKAALAIKQSTSAHESDRYRVELTQALTDWTRVHQGLIAGDAELQLPAAANEEIAFALGELSGPFENIRVAASRIDGPATASDVAVILATEPDYLARMDHIVSLYEHEAQRQVERLRRIGMLAMVLVVALMAGLGRLVLRPATQLIRRQMEALTDQGVALRAARDKLEERVRERTVELLEANASLSREMAERRAVEERNRTLQNQLAHAARVTSLGQLATGLAHEINQPLAAIANFAESADVALSTPAPGDVRPLVQRIRDAALRAGQIVRRMRNFVRPADAAPAVVSLRSLIEEVLSLCWPELVRDQVELSQELEIDTEDLVSVDAIQIQQVLVNLVQNAAQSMLAELAGQRQLTIRLTRGEDECQVDVEDTGPGFAADRTDLVSQPFATTKPDGLGMGLAISRSILLAHGGRLWAANREGGGARVSFVLPGVARGACSSPLSPRATTVSRREVAPESRSASDVERSPAGRG